MKNPDKISRGNGFRGLLDYVSENADSKDSGEHVPGRLIGGTMSGTNPRELSSEFGVGRKLRPDCKKPVWHNALRLPPGDTLTDEQWRPIADRHMELMGFDLSKTQVCYWSHADEGALHIVASRIALDGSLYYGRDENLMNTRATQQIEREFGLRISAGPELAENGLPKPASKKKAKKNEIEKALRTGVQPARLQIQAAVDSAVAAHPKNLPEFREHLAAVGVTLHIHNHPETGKPRGVSFECEGIRFSGSQLGEAYKFQALQRRTANENAHENNTHESRAGARTTDSPGSPTVDQAGSRSAAPARTPERPGTTPAGAGERPARTIRPIQVAPAAARTAALEKKENKMKPYPLMLPHGATGAIGSPIKSMIQVQHEVCRPEETRNEFLPPTLGGRLTAVKLPYENGYDLFWKDRADGKPSFRWQPAGYHMLVLAQPNEKNVGALFDAAAEKGIGMPQIQITGTPEFQRLAAIEAAKRGLPVDTSKLDESAAELYRATFSQQHSESANSISVSAYESQRADEQKRIEKAERAARADRDREAAESKDGNRSRDHMRM